MSVLMKATVLLEGMPGLPGTNTFHADPENVDPGAFVDGIVEFYNAFKSNLAADLTMTVQGLLLRIESTTGAIVGTDDGGSDQVVVGGNSGEFLPLATQGLISWRTGVFFGGRELRGRTFICGFVEGLNDNGVPNADLVTAMSGFADTFALALAIYSPTKHEWAQASTGRMWSQWAELRSRRD